MRHGALLMTILGLASINATSEAGEPYAPRVGLRHPDFTLPTIGDRSPVALSNFLGKKVLLIQFASW